jgi:hypothetical protein
VGTVGDEMRKSRHSKSRGWTVHQDGADWWEGDERGPIARDVGCVWRHRQGRSDMGQAMKKSTDESHSR